MRSLVSSLIYLALLEFFLFFPEKIIFLLPALLIILFIGALEKRFFKLSIFTLPFIFGLSSFLILTFLDNPISEQIIAISSAFALYFVFKYDAKDLKNANEKKGGPESFSQKALQAVILASAFLCYTILHKALLEFPYPDWINLIPVFLISLFLSFRFLKTLHPISSKLLLFSAFLALIATQISWILLYLPFTPIVLALVLTSLLFFLLNILEFHLKNLLSKRLILRNIFLFITIVAISLLSSPWTA
jgi:hypothetical protein